MYRYDENSKPVQHVFVSIVRTIFRVQLVNQSILNSRVLETFKQRILNDAMKSDSIDIWAEGRIFDDFALSILSFPDRSSFASTFQVDYQMSIYTSPAIDLLYFLNATVQNEVNTESLLEEYVNTLTSTMKRLGCKTTPPTIKDIKKYMRERIAWGMLAAATVLPFTLMDKSQVVSLDELIKRKDTFDYPGTKNPMYRKVMAERLVKFEEAGVFD